MVLIHWIRRGLRNIIEPAFSVSDFVFCQSCIHNVACHSFLLTSASYETWTAGCVQFMHPVSLDPREKNCRVNYANHDLSDHGTTYSIWKKGAGLSDNFGKPQGRKSAHNILNWGPTPNIAREYGNYGHVKGFHLSIRWGAITLRWLDLCAGYGTGNIMYIKTGINRVQGVSVPILCPYSPLEIVKSFYQKNSAVLFTSLLAFKGLRGGYASHKEYIGLGEQHTGW